MGIRRRTTSGSTDKPQQHTRPLERDYVAEVQRRLAHLTQESERHPESVSGTTLTDKQRRRIEQEMASLRAEALKARRLAEQIENLSHETTRLKRKSVMTESFTTSPGQVDHESRRKSDTSKSGASQLSFNPLHPSMELPPEQLIRLLGLETKKIRKRKRAYGNVADKHFPTSARHTEMLQEPVKPASLIPVRCEHRSARRDFQNERRGILLPAVAMGVLIGVAAAGYLFLSKPPIATTHPASAEAGSGRASDSQIPASSPDQTGKNVQPYHRPVAAPTTSKPAETTQVATPPPADDFVIPVDPARQAAIEAELAKLRAEAEQRFARQMSRIEASREAREVQATAIQQEGAETALPNQLEVDPTSDPDMNWQPQVTSEVTDPATAAPAELFEDPIRTESSATTPSDAETLTPSPDESIGETGDLAPEFAAGEPAVPGDVNLQETYNDERKPASSSAERAPVEPSGRIVRQAGSAPEFAPEVQHSEIPEIQPPAVTDTGSF